MGHRPANLSAHLEAHGVRLTDGASIVFRPAQPGESVEPRVPGERWRVAVIPGAAWNQPDRLLRWLDENDFDDAVAAERWPTECVATLRRSVRQRALEHEVAALTAQTEHALEQLETSVRIATGVQRVLLSRLSPRFPGVALQFKYVPGKGKGGDYYDFLPLEDGRRFVLLLAEGRSHGVVAGLLSALLRLSLADVARLAAPPSTAIRHFQEALAADGDSPELLGLSVAVFDRPSLTLTLATTAESLRPALTRQGRWSVPETGQNRVLQLLPGDRLCFATGGVRALGAPSLLALLDEIGDRDPLDTQNEVMARVRKLPAMPDDLTFLQIAVDAKALFVAQSK